MFTLNCKGRLLVVDKPIVMGIINATPDSFYSGSRAMAVDDVLEKASRMMKDGATILDIGAQSTRPGSKRITATEELERAIPVVEALHGTFPNAILSIDTYHAEVAQRAIEAGVSMVNDISAGSIDEKMFSTVARNSVPYICMHMQGTPESMQDNPQYENVSREVLDFFIRKTEECSKAGINDIIIDPGFGFGKSGTHNFRLLKELSLFRILNRPLLLGISRKGTIYKTLNITPEEALNGTTVLNTIGLLNGAHILRVHDVKEAMEAITLFNQYQLA